MFLVILQKANRKHRIPQISAGNSLQSYITKSSHGAQIDTALLVKPEERELASVVRKVEDPVIVKAKAVEVCCLETLFWLRISTILL